MIEIRADLDDLFIRCGSCELVAEPIAADAARAAAGGVDLTAGASRAQCQPCGHWQPLTAPVVVADRSATFTCRRCQATRPCPADAARVRCRGCGVYGMGPGAAEPASADRLRITEGLPFPQSKSASETRGLFVRFR